MLGFFILFGYGITRPVVDSLFIEKYGSKSLPFVWPWTTLAVTIILAIYNQFNTKYSIMSIFRVSVILSFISLLVFIICYHFDVPYTLYPFIIWKDTYIVVFVEIFWTYSDLKFTLHKAKNLYGFFLACGSIGGLSGAFLLHPLITHFEHTIPLIIVLISFAILFLLSLALGPTENNLPQKTKKKFDFKIGLGVLKTGHYLIPLLIMVLLTQISITFLEYEYSMFLEKMIPNLDERTKLMGTIQGTIDIISIGLQLSTGFLVNKIGLTSIIVSIPLFTAIAVIFFIIAPQLITVCLFRITSKCFDYSLFKATKEMLYVPLSAFEKTQGKAIIDIFVYRMAKGISSILLIFFSFIEPLYVVLILLMGWSYCASIIAKRYKKHYGFIN